MTCNDNVTIEIVETANDHHPYTANGQSLESQQGLLTKGPTKAANCLRLNHAGMNEDDDGESSSSQSFIMITLMIIISQDALA